MSVRGPKNADEKDRQKRQNKGNRDGSIAHTAPPACILRRVGWDGGEFGPLHISKVTSDGQAGAKESDAAQEKAARERVLPPRGSVMEAVATVLCRMVA